MKKILLPNGLNVSPVCLGAMNFGTTTSEEDSFKVLDAFVDMGGNFIDTSNNYAHWAGTGDESETVLGKWIKARGKREDLVIATKVGFDRHGQGAGLKKEQIEYWIDQSLKKLNVDYVDLYYAHTDDVNTPLEETMEAFDKLVKKGKVKNLGVSNYDTWRVVEANAVAKEKNLTPYTVMQQRFTYLHPRYEVAPKYAFNEQTTRERMRFLFDKNMPLVAYSCLAKGGYVNQEKIPIDHVTGKRLEVLTGMAKDKGVSANALVVAYLTNLDKIKGNAKVIPLFGSSKVSHFTDNLKGLTIDLTEEELLTLYNA